MERIHHDTGRTNGIRPINHSLVVLQQRAMIIYHCLPGHPAHLKLTLIMSIASFKTDKKPHRLIPGPRMTLVRVIPVFSVPNDDIAQDNTASMGVHA